MKKLSCEEYNALSEEQKIHYLRNAPRKPDEFINELERENAQIGYRVMVDGWQYEVVSADYGYIIEPVTNKDLYTIIYPPVIQ